VLSDPQLRKQYNEFGQKNGGGGAEAAFQDPEELFGQMFGGDKFEDLIGTISIGEWSAQLQSLVRQLGWAHNLHPSQVHPDTLQART
jgi:DnaJ-class molecular chaperone